LVNPRQKGHRGEQQVLSMLERLTNEKWVQTPGSGSGKIKGDCMVPDKVNLSIKILVLIVKYTLRKVIIFSNGGVNFVNKHNKWDKNHC